MGNEYYNGILCYIYCNYLCYNIGKNITCLLINFQRSLLTFLKNDKIYVTKHQYTWQESLSPSVYLLEHSIKGKISKALLFLLTEIFPFYLSFIWRSIFQSLLSSSIKEKTGNSWLIRSQCDNQNRVAINRATTEQSQSKMNPTFWIFTFLTIT